MASGHGHYYKGIDNNYEQTEQGQSQAIPESNTKRVTAVVVTSGLDHYYKAIDNNYDQAGQDRSQAYLNPKSWKELRKER